MLNPRILFVVACTWAQKGFKGGQDQKMWVWSAISCPHGLHHWVWWPVCFDFTFRVMKNLTKFFQQKFLQLWVCVCIMADSFTGEITISNSLSPLFCFIYSIEWFLIIETLEYRFTIIRRVNSELYALMNICVNQYFSFECLSNGVKYNTLYSRTWMKLYNLLKWNGLGAKENM